MDCTFRAAPGYSAGILAPATAGGICDKDRSRISHAQPGGPVLVGQLHRRAGSRRHCPGTSVLIARGQLEVWARLDLGTGELFIMGAVVTWAIYSILLKLRPATVPPMALLTSTVIVGLVFMLPAYAWSFAPLPLRPGRGGVCCTSPSSPRCSHSCSGTEA